MTSHTHTHTHTYLSRDLLKLRMQIQGKDLCYCYLPNAEIDEDERTDQVISAPNLDSVVPSYSSICCKKYMKYYKQKYYTDEINNDTLIYSFLFEKMIN